MFHLAKHWTKAISNHVRLLGILFTVGMALVLTTLVIGCQNQIVDKQKNKAQKARPVGSSEVELKVWAAASLKDALQELAGVFEERENVKLVYNFAASGDLQVQIEQGAPADVFISAGAKQVDALEKEKLIDSSSRRKLLGNSLVLIVPQSNSVSIPKIETLPEVDGIDKIVIGNPDEVPAGKYARDALETAGILNPLRSRLVLAKDVRQVLSYVETGNVDAGFVYLTDAKTSKKVKIALRIPASYHEPIAYPAAIVLSGKQRALAARFVDYLEGKEAAVVFKKYGFMDER